MYRVYFLSITYLMLCFCTTAQEKAGKEEYYQISVYQYHTIEQEQQLEAYLQHALLPAAHRAKVASVGIFKVLGNDTAAVKKIYVLMPLKNIRDWEQLQDRIYEDKLYQSLAHTYLNMANKPGMYDRIETIVLKIFPGAPLFKTPTLSVPKADRIYELRSYESSTEKQHRNKIEMFIAGEETVIFDRLHFNAIFYGRVLAGSKMPNLMYMTTHANMEERNKNWKNFLNDAAWKKLKDDPQYLNNVSHIDIIFLKATPYSDF